MSNPTPDDIERWEWEGGAVAADANGASSVRDEPAQLRAAGPPGRPEEARTSTVTDSE